jgi:hypothetical protein
MPRVPRQNSWVRVTAPTRGRNTRYQVTSAKRGSPGDGNVVDAEAHRVSLREWHVMAACATSDAAVVLTVDPRDVSAPVTALPGIRIVTRNPVSPL